MTTRTAGRQTRHAMPGHSIYVGDLARRAALLVSPGRQAPPVPLRAPRPGPLPVVPAGSELFEDTLPDRAARSAGLPGRSLSAVPAGSELFEETLPDQAAWSAGQSEIFPPLIRREPGFPKADTRNDLPRDIHARPVPDAPGIPIRDLMRRAGSPVSNEG